MTTSAHVPDTDTAFNVLTHDVRGRAFFHKLASLGYVPQTEKQAEAYLMMAEDIRKATDHPTVKQAAEASDPVLSALGDLRTTLQRRGVMSKTANDEAFAAQAASQFMQDPTYYNSVLALKFAEANEFAAHHGLEPVS